MDCAVGGDGDAMLNVFDDFAASLGEGDGGSDDETASDMTQRTLRRPENKQHFDLHSKIRATIVPELSEYSTVGAAKLKPEISHMRVCVKELSSDDSTRAARLCSTVQYNSSLCTASSSVLLHVHHRIWSAYVALFVICLYVCTV